MFLIFWKRVCLGMWKLAHWRKNCVIDSKSLPQVQKGLNSSWKQCLNICSWRRLRPRRNPHPIQDGLFRGCSQMERVGGGGRQKAPSLKSVTHIVQWWNLAVIPYLMKIHKIYESRDLPLGFCWYQHSFTGNKQILLYQEIQM